MDMASPELEAYRKASSMLEIAIKDNIRPIIEKLSSSGFVKSEVYEELRETSQRLSAVEKSRLLVGSIEDAITISPEKYHELVKILSDKAIACQYKDIVHKLQTFFGMLNDCCKCGPTN